MPKAASTSNVPAAAKKPQDHKPKTDEVDTSKPFTFEAGGDAYEVSGIAEAVTAGFIRRHRSDDPLEVTFALFEDVADEETLAAFDALPLSEGGQVLAKFDEYCEPILGVKLGEL